MIEKKIVKVEKSKVFNLNPLTEQLLACKMKTQTLTVSCCPACKLRV